MCICFNYLGFNNFTHFNSIRACTNHSTIFATFVVFLRRISKNTPLKIYNFRWQNTPSLEICTVVLSYSFIDFNASTRIYILSKKNCTQLIYFHIINIFSLSLMIIYTKFLQCIQLT